MPSCKTSSCASTSNPATGRSRGVARLRHSCRIRSYAPRMLTRADDLAKMTVLDAHKQAVELGSLWRDKPAVLVFVRHFG